MSNMEAWIGIDLDGTLAQYDGYKGSTHIGEPVPLMATRVHRLRTAGKKVKIFTARADDPEAVVAIKAWLQLHGFGDLEVTNIKDYGMIVLYDDRAIGIIPNTGKRCDGIDDLK